MTKAALSKCRCGGQPKYECVRVAEDAEECWVVCPKCGAETDKCEDAYCDFATAGWLWNSGLAAQSIDR